MSAPAKAARRARRWPWWAAAGAVLLAVLGWRLGWFGAPSGAGLLGAKAERKALVVSVTQRGNLAARDPIVIKSEIEGQTTILSLVKEGTSVQAGDLLVELDASELEDRRVAQEIAVQSADAAYVKAKAQHDIQVSQNESDIEAAQRQLDFAQIDRRKYEEGDRAQALSQADEKIKLSEAEQANATNTYNWSKSLADRGFLTKSELDRDELDMQRANVALDQAKRAKDLLVRFDDTRRLRELAANVAEAERRLERARLQAQARLADFQSTLASSDSKLGLEREKLQKLQLQIKRSRITAPEAGLVVYARVEGGGRMGNSEPIQVGTTVRERQEILSIPRTAGLIIEASVHESVLKQVVVGKPCRIKVDALEGQQFDGRVQFVALLADKGSWWANPNQRLYGTEIEVLNPVPEMKPGMSCSVEILNEIVPDALVVPLQSVFLDAGKPIAFVAHGLAVEQRSVETGRSSQTLVEIVKGLEPGETVLLAPPSGFTPRPAESSAENGALDFPAAGAAPAEAGAPAVPAAEAGAENGAAGARERGAGGRPGGGAGSERPGGRRRGERPAGNGAGTGAGNGAGNGSGSGTGTGPGSGTGKGAGTGAGQGGSGSR